MRNLQEAKRQSSCLSLNLLKSKEILRIKFELRYVKIHIF
ncbi:hypothetical protein CAMRE0001_0515 [Campylobacter rectus RM3267]|uniref:Uncharacterized protein n=1 Tax=Campylobacter rectus RM3267 TaxID=553218 RepID=B9D2Z2_CAMRE|nr:hypothetical protein CAMRE0001_0515 [Campylobacter rectus RM3267]